MFHFPNHSFSHLFETDLAKLAGICQGGKVTELAIVITSLSPQQIDGNSANRLWPGNSEKYGPE
jgi:hypothetical protein